MYTYVSCTQYQYVYKYFTKEIADEIIKIGEKATDKLIPQIKALLEK